MITYKANPTATDFHQSNALVKALYGPVGTGKSVACMMELMKLALSQKPSMDGVRRTRWGIIRNTYPELRSTTIKTWMEWFHEWGEINYQAPITFTSKFKMEDGTSVHAEFIFVSVDKEKDFRKLLSLELTGAYINEASEIHMSKVLTAVKTRFRYPKQERDEYGTVVLEGPTKKAMLLDTNPPDDDHWFYKLFEETKPAGHEIFKYPAALIKKHEQWVPNPVAENIDNLGGGWEYYLDPLPGMQEEEIRVKFAGEYGSSFDGKPVYPEYCDFLHYDENLQIDEYRPISIGIDFGLTPACVITQYDELGRLKVLDEITTDGMGIKEFTYDVLHPHLRELYHGIEIEAFIGDPAGTQRAQTDTQTCLNILRKAGFDAQPASTNSFIARREAVAGFLNKTVGEYEDMQGFIISAACPSVRKGFMGGYKYQRVQVVGTERFKDRPDKNHFSHCHDALQYVALYHANREGAMRKKASPKKVSKIHRGSFMSM